MAAASFALQVKHQSAVKSTNTVLPPLTSSSSLVFRKRLPGDTVEFVTGEHRHLPGGISRGNELSFQGAFEPLGHHVV